MKHFSKLFLLLLLSLNFVALTIKTSAYSFTQIQTPYDFSVQEASAQAVTIINPQITVTTGQARLRITCPMAGRSNLHAALQNYNFSPIPNFKTGTVPEFTDYLTPAR